MKSVSDQFHAKESCGIKALTAMKQASQIADENDISDMTLDEINAEISDVRDTKKADQTCSNFMQ